MFEPSSKELSSQMKIASLWSNIVNGVPKLDPSLKQAHLEDLNHVLKFLQSGKIVMRANGFMTDWLDDEKPKIIPIGFRTDGTWIWPNEISFYLETHSIIPNQEFLNYIRANNYQAKEVSEQELLTAQKLLVFF